MSRATMNTLRIAPYICRPKLTASSTTVLQRLPTGANVRWSSHSPLGAALTNARKPVTINTIQSLYRKNDPITMITAHDFPSAAVADHAGMDIVLVGDSLAMVAMGMEDTSEVLLDEMILHCKSVARATKGAFTVCLVILCFVSILIWYRSVTYPWAAMKSHLSKLLLLLSE